jgi:DNA-binding NtrC family response regulator
MKETVLIVEDNEAIRMIVEEFLSILLDLDTANVVSVADVAHAEAAFKEWKIALVLTDVNLGAGPDGLSLIDSMNTVTPRPFIAVMSSLSGLKPTEEYLQRGLIDFFLSKPFTLQNLRTMLEQTGVVALFPRPKRRVAPINCRVVSATDASNAVKAQQ